MKHLEIFTRLKNGEIVCIESCNIEKKKFFGFTFHSRVLKLKHYKFDEIDDSWVSVDCNEKLEILKKYYKPLDYYDYKGITVQRRHGLLTDSILVIPFLDSKKVA
jgi:hypothetical protein